MEERSPKLKALSTEIGQKVSESVHTGCSTRVEQHIHIYTSNKPCPDPGQPPGHSAWTDCIQRPLATYVIMEARSVWGHTLEMTWRQIPLVKTHCCWTLYVYVIECHPKTTKCLNIVTLCETFFNFEFIVCFSISRKRLVFTIFRFDFDLIWLILFHHQFSVYIKVLYIGMLWYDEEKDLKPRLMSPYSHSILTRCTISIISLTIHKAYKLDFYSI